VQNGVAVILLVVLVEAGQRTWGPTQSKADHSRGLEGRVVLPPVGRASGGFHLHLRHHWWRLRGREWKEGASGWMAAISSPLWDWQSFG